MELSGKLENVLQPVGAALLPSAEATEALVSLGYQRHLAARAVEGAVASLGVDASVEDVVRTALKTLSSMRKGQP